METGKCPHCGGQANIGYKKCTHCGGQIDWTTQEEKMQRLIMFISLVVALPIIYFILKWMGEFD